jgi:hypothetical protein
MPPATLMQINALPERETNIRGIVHIRLEKIMDSFEAREHAAESSFAHELEEQFLARMVRVKILALLWQVDWNSWNRRGFAGQC